MRILRTARGTSRWTTRGCATTWCRTIRRPGRRSRALYDAITLADPYERACAHLAHGDGARGRRRRGPAGVAGAVGPATVFELTTLVGYYATLSPQLRIFRVD